MRLAFLSVCVVLVGCQSGVNIDAREDSFCDEFAEVACYNMYRCCSERLIEQELGVSEPRTEAQCREDKRRNCVRASASLRDSLAAGRVTFNAAPLNECLNSILAPDDTCSTYVTELPWVKACEGQVWVGTVAMGGACFFDHDCAGAPKSAECGPDQKCVALPTSGFPCPGGQCAEGFFCSGTTGTCQAQLAENAPCQSTSQCQKDLFCDTTATPMPICTARKPAGSACTSDFGCISGDCVPGKCAVTNATCYKDTDCSGRCADDNSFCTVGMDYQCNIEGKCTLNNNLSCSGSTADQYCAANSAGTCMFNYACVPGDCVGDPVCTAPLFLADYCTAGLGLTP